MKYAFILGFLLLAIVQWVIPGKTIWEKNQVLKEGKAYKFRTEPVDPSDPFKGKFITLNFAESTFTDTVDRKLASNDIVYVLLGQDQQGYSIVKDLSATTPRNTTAYVQARVLYASRDADSITVHLDYPFDEFYMDEYKAPKAETVFREANRDTSNITYALVRIRDGDAVIENVFINNTPIGTLAR